MTLTPQHLQHLAASAINPTIIAERGYTSIAPGSTHDWRQIAGGTHSDKLLRTILHQGALAFPIFHLGDPAPYTWVLRPDQPRTDANGKAIKYEWPRSTANVFDVLPRSQAALADPTIPLWITEGCKKADALISIYGTAIVAINENGVYGWRSRNAKGGIAASPDLSQIAWNGRTVVIAPDGDVKHNPNVLRAVQQLAQILTGRYAAREVLICHLPQSKAGPKVGVDDYLAQGHTTDDLAALLTTLAAVASAHRVPLCKHPASGVDLFLPAGYAVAQQTIVRSSAGGQAPPQTVYEGVLLATETSHDLHTREESVTLTWNGRGNHHATITIPRAALVDGREFGRLTAAAGAAVHAENARKLTAYLTSFIQENRDELPHCANVGKLGIVDDGLVTPAGAVGFAEPVRYTGSRRFVIGTDRDIYRQTLTEALTWPGTESFWLTLALSLAAPVIGRMDLRRNPVLYHSGSSGSGKTTICQFATGAWSCPTASPFRIEAGRSTPAGIFQTLDELNGLPTFLDEAHTIPHPERLEMACYGFANGQRYAVGSANGTAQGGTPLSGALFLAGEAVPVFKHAGSTLRVLWADAGTWLPLGTGAEPQSALGLCRAARLERAWESGAGVLGLQIAKTIWAHWPEFAAGVDQFAALPVLQPLREWRRVIAIAGAVLNVLLESVCGIDPAESWAFQQACLAAWVQMLTEGHEESNPALAAWEALVTLLAQGEQRHDGMPNGWEWIDASHHGGMLACRASGDDYWRVITNTPQFEERVGKAAVQLYGREWIRRGFVLPGTGGKTTEVKHIRDIGSMRCLLIPCAQLREWAAQV